MSSIIKLQTINISKVLYISFIDLRLNLFCEPLQFNNFTSQQICLVTYVCLYTKKSLNYTTIDFQNLKPILD